MPNYRVGDNTEKKDVAWGLGEEKHFLDDLGTGKWSRFTHMSRYDLLKNYIKIIVYRKEPWAKHAFAYANLLLKMEE